MFLLLQVPAVILNVVKDPEEPHATQPLEPFNPHLLLLPLLLHLPLLFFSTQPKPRHFD
jgi:hypothetical protein